MKYLLILAMSVLVSTAYAAPEWAQKPVQCGPFNEILNNVQSQKLDPLFGAYGNVRIDNKTVTVPYVFYYNMDSKYWTFVEIHREDYACVVGIGEGIDFDVQN